MLLVFYTLWCHEPWGEEPPPAPPPLCLFFLFFGMAGMGKFGYSIFGQAAGYIRCSYAGCSPSSTIIASIIVPWG